MQPGKCKALSTWQILVCSFLLCGFTDYRQGIIHWMTHYHVYCQALIKDEQIFGFPHCSSLHRCLTDTKGTLKFTWKHKIFSRKKFYHIWNSVLCNEVFMIFPIERKSVTSRYHGNKILDLNNLSWQIKPLALCNDGRNAWATVLFMNAIMHRNVMHINFLGFFCHVCRTTPC